MILIQKYRLQKKAAIYGFVGLSVLFTTAFNLLAQSVPEVRHGFRSQIAGLIRKAPQGKSLGLLTPSQLKALKVPNREMTTADVDPCETPVEIVIGEIANGTINQSDCQIDEGVFGDIFIFSGTQGQVVPIHLSSPDFDTLLAVVNESETLSLVDDDSGGGTNSRIIATLPETGLYAIFVTSVFTNQQGRYALSLAETPFCTYSISPSGAQISPSGGTFGFEVTTQTGCGWRAYPPDIHHWLDTDSGGPGSGIATFTAEPNGPTARSGTITVVPGYSLGPQQPNLVYTVEQPPLVCSYSVSTSSVSLPAAEHIGTINITATDGCYWSGQANSWFISTNSYGRGSGTLTFLIGNNNDADRVGTLTVAGQTVTIAQAGLNCTFSVTPVSIAVDRRAGSGSINVETQPGCTWVVYRDTWVQAGGFGLRGNGPGSVTYRVYANPYPFSRSDYIGFNSMGATGSFNIPITQSATSPPASVSGRVLTPDGRGLRNTLVIMKDSQNVEVSVTTNTAGYFSIEGVRTGETYSFRVVSRRYKFPPKSGLQVNSDLSGLSFVGTE
jgi:hypothetical protein